MEALEDYASKDMVPWKELWETTMFWEVLTDHLVLRLHPTAGLIGSSDFFLEFTLTVVISGVNRLFWTYFSHMTSAWLIVSEVSCPVIGLFCNFGINRKA